MELERLVKTLDSDFSYLARIERVHGLSHFKHEVVCEVGKEIDSSHAAVVKADSHVYGAYVACDVFNLHAGVALTERILDFHVNLLEVVVSGYVLNGQRL